EGSGVEIAGNLGGPAVRVVAPRLERLPLLFHLSYRILAHPADGGQVRSQLSRRHRSGAAIKIEAALALLLVLVLRLPIFGRVLVVAGQRLVGIVGNTLFQRLKVKHAQQGVAAANIGVEETERLPR